MQRITKRLRDIWITLRVYYIALRLEWGTKYILYKYVLGLRLYSYGITRYSIKYFLHRFWGVLKWIIGIGFVIYVLATGPEYVYSLVRAWVAENLVNPAQFFTEALVLLIVELPILYLVTRISGESKSPVARLEVNPSRPTQIEDGSSILGMNITNVGEVAAVSCEARLTFELRPDHLIDSATQVLFNRDNFKPPLKTKVPWSSGTLYANLRVGDFDEIPIVRVSKERFEVPSEQGWTPISLSARPDHDFGAVKVVPLNGRPTLVRFVLRQFDTFDRYGRSTGVVYWGVQRL